MGPYKSWKGGRVTCDVFFFRTFAQQKLKGSLGELYSLLHYGSRMWQHDGRIVWKQARDNFCLISKNSSDFVGYV